MTSALMTPSSILQELGVGVEAPAPIPLPEQIVEFARRRRVVYDVRDQLRSEKSRIPGLLAERTRLCEERSKLRVALERCQKRLDVVQEDLKLWETRQGQLNQRLDHRMEDMAVFLDEKKAIRVYSDMSLGRTAAFGGLVLEGGAMIPLMGSVYCREYPTDSVALETLALCIVTEWVGREWPDAILEVFTDCGPVVSLMETFVRFGDPPNSPMMAFLLAQITRRLTPYRARIFPRWQSRETTEIRICDAMSRRYLGDVPPREPWLHMLVLAQGELKDRWSPAATQVLHYYHRYCQRGRGLSRDQISPRPPA